MPKSKYTLRSFAGGINTLRDPRDLADNESSQIDNMSIDAQGKIKSAGSFYTHRTNPTNTSATSLVKAISTATASLDNRSNSSPGTATGRTNKGGGFNLFYFESDHSKRSEWNDNESATYTVGASNGNIWFVNPQNSDVTGTLAVSPSDSDDGGSGSSL